MDLIRPGLIAAAVSLGVALACLAVAALLGRRRGPDQPPASRWGVPLGLGLGYALGHAALRDWLHARPWPPFPFPPIDATDWLPWTALLAMWLGLFDALFPAPAWARWENRLLLTALMLWLLLGPLFGGLWESTRQGVEWLIGLGLGILAFWAILEGRADRLGRSWLAPLLILAVGTAAALVLSGSLVLGELAGSLAATLGACWAFSWGSPRLSLARGGVPVVALVLPGLILAGVFYSELPRPSALLLAAAPLATRIDLIPPIRRRKAWQAGLIRSAAMLVPVAAAVGNALANAPAAEPY